MGFLGESQLRSQQCLKKEKLILKTPLWTLTISLMFQNSKKSTLIQTLLKPQELDGKSYQM